MTRITGKLSDKINAWLKKNALKYRRSELPKILTDKFGVPVSRVSVRNREGALNIARVGEIHQTVPVEEAVLQRRTVKRAHEETGVYRRLYDTLQKDHERLAKEFKAALEIGSYEARNAPIRAVAPSKTAEATAIVLASDWHVEEEVRPENVNHQNKFNLEIARTRARNFFERTARLVKKERQDVQIKTLVLWLGGDMISGNIHEELLESCLLEPAKAILFAYDLIDSGIKFLLKETDLNLVVVCSVGNHSRMTKKVHVSTERGNSLEWIMYHVLAKNFAGDPRIKFVIEDSYHTYLDVYRFKVRFHHGHALRYQGGLGGLHIPLNRAIAQWDKSIRSDVDCMGHWHQYTPSRRYIVNGSLIGYNPYGIWIKGEYEPPMQAFFLLDRDKGVTVQMPIFVEPKVIP